MNNAKRSVKGVKKISKIQDPPSWFTYPYAYQRGKYYSPDKHLLLRNMRKGEFPRGVKSDGGKPIILFQNKSKIPALKWALVFTDIRECPFVRDRRPVHINIAWCYFLKDKVSAMSTWGNGIENKGLFCLRFIKETPGLG